jgi:mRNA interferase MazF
MARLAQRVVCWANLPDPAGRRPVLVLTRTDALPRLNSATVAPLTRTRRGVNTEVLLTPEQDGVRTECAVSLDNILTVPREMLDEPIATLSRARMEQVFEAIRAAFDMQ